MRKKPEAMKKGMALMGNNAHSQPAGIYRSLLNAGISSEATIRGGGDIRLRYPPSRVDIRGVEEFQKNAYTVKYQRAGISSCLELGIALLGIALQ